MEKFRSMKQARETYPADDYLLLTDDEADKAAREYIQESMWAFSSVFLAECTDLPAELFVYMGTNWMENKANDVVLRLVELTCGFEYFSKTALSIDGRGSYLAGYDGHEVEVIVGKKLYYLYRK